MSPESFADLVNVLPETWYQEERDAYERSLKQLQTNPSDPTSIVSATYHGAVFMRSLALITDRWIAPLTQFCVERHKQNLKEVGHLR